MNAVLSCVSGKDLDFMSDFFLEHGANDSGFGECGSHEERKNLNIVREALRKRHLSVRVWGCASMRAFQSNEVSSFGLLGRRYGRCVGELIWCREEQHVYVCSDLGDFEEGVHWPVAPWSGCVVGGLDDMPVLTDSSSDEIEAPCCRDADSDTTLSDDEFGEVGNSCVPVTSNTVSSDHVLDGFLPKQCDESSEEYLCRPCFPDGGGARGDSTPEVGHTRAQDKEDSTDGSLLYCGAAGSSR